MEGVVGMVGVVGTLGVVEPPVDVPPVEDPVPPTGEGMTGVMVAIVAALAMSAILALGWDAKRKF